MAAPGSVESEPELSYRQLLTDSSLLSVLGIAFAGAMATNSIPAALPAIEGAFGVGNERVGLVMTAFYFPVIFMNPVIGILIDIWGRRRIVIPSLLVFGVTGMAVFWVTTFSGLLVLRGIQGIAYAATLPLTATLVGDLYSGPEGSTAQGIRGSIGGIANTAAPVLAGFLAVVSWQYPFLVFALAFPLAGLIFWKYPEPVEPRTERSTVTLASELRTYWHDIVSEANDRSLIVLILGASVTYFMKQGLKVYVPIYAVTELNADIPTAGAILGVYGLVRILMSPLAGPITLYIGRKNTLIVSLGVMIVGCVFIPLSPAVPVLAAAVGFYTIGEATYAPTMTSGVADLVRDENRGGIMSGFSTAKSVANTGSPAILGIVLGFGSFLGLYIVCALVGAFYLVGLALIADRRRVNHGYATA